MAAKRDEKAPRPRQTEAARVEFSNRKLKRRSKKIPATTIVLE